MEGNKSRITIAIEKRFKSYTFIVVLKPADHNFVINFYSVSVQVLGTSITKQSYGKK